MAHAASEPGVLDWSGAGFDLSANAAAPLARWAEEIKARGVFKRKGEGPDEFDCWGLAAFVLALIGRPAPSYSALYNEAAFETFGAPDRLLRAEAQAWARAPGEVGDVLICARGGFATHVAVLAGDGKALHALDGAGVVLTPLIGRKRVTHLMHMKLVGCLRPASSVR